VSKRAEARLKWPWRRHRFHLRCSRRASLAFAAVHRHPERPRKCSSQIPPPACRRRASADVPTNRWVTGKGSDCLSLRKVRRGSREKPSRVDATTSSSPPRRTARWVMIRTNAALDHRRERTRCTACRRTTSTSIKSISHRRTQTSRRLFQRSTTSCELAKCARSAHRPSLRAKP
jgi:hypothetical protein